MELSQINNIYFIGIGGAGMSALARYFNMKNKAVFGYDKAESDVTHTLSNLGIQITYQDVTEAIPSQVLTPNETLVVYTPAIPRSHEQLCYFQNNNYTVLKRSEVLGIITKDTFCLAVSGTHGKTTTTSILAHLMYTCDVPVVAFLGGVCEGYNSNLIFKGDTVSVVEADEFDRSFLTLSPNFACITSMDADHLDIYGDATVLEKTFEAFSEKIALEGLLFTKKGLPIEGITYGIEAHADYDIQNIRIDNGCYLFDVKTPKGNLTDIAFNLPGRHNLENALVAMAMALEYGCPASELIEALKTYKGVKRRFTYHIKTEDVIYIDDYAHHPEEINSVYNAVTELYPDKKILAIFQPHLYSRTQDFSDAFAEQLSKFDDLILLDIYPAREVPIPGVTSSWLLSKVKHDRKKVVSKQNLFSIVQQSDADVVLTLGAGDIGELVMDIKHVLTC